MVVPSTKPRCNKWSTKARGKEKLSDWLGAASDYRRSVRAHFSSGEFLEAGRVQERIGLCLLRRAFQAKTLEGFRTGIKSAIDAYQRGIEIFRKMNVRRKEAEISFCKAKGAYAKSWIEEKSSVKRKLLQESCLLAEKALNIYEHVGDQGRKAKICNDLVQYLDERLRIETRRNVTQKLLKESDKYSEKAIEESTVLADEFEIARAYYNAGHHFYVSVFLRPLNEETERNRQKALGYLQRVIDLFRKMDEPYLQVLADLDFGRIAYSRITMEPELGIEHFHRVSRQASNIRDNHAASISFFRLALNSWWMLRLEQDLEKKRQWYHRCVEYAKKAIRHSSCLSDHSGIAFAHWLHAYAKHAFAEELETETNRRRLLLEESIDISREGVKHAERSGVLEAVHFTRHSLCISLFLFSQVENDEEKKREALKEAVERGEECIKAAKAAIPYDLWNLGINECFLALILLHEAEIDSERKSEKYLHKKASLHWTKGHKMALDYLALYPDGKRYWAIGGLGFLYGESLYHLHRSADEKDMLEELVEVYAESALMFRQVGASHLVAQAQWQIARTLDLQGEFSEAAKCFDRASRSFRAASEKTPLVKYWYMDHALYMLAWKEIEEAKLYRESMNHFKSAEHYRKASVYLKETFKWRYLSPYYLALSQVELGEELKRRNELEEAKRTFDEATATFERAEILLKGREGFAESPEERKEILKLSRIANVKRKSYTRQVTAEEAKVLEVLPDHHEEAVGLNAFNDAYIRARITAPKDFAVGREITICLDLVNIGRKPGVVVRIERLVPSCFFTLETPSGYSLEGESLNMEGHLLGPLQALSLNIKVRPLDSNAVELDPRVVYINYHGDFVVHDVKSVLIRPVVAFQSEAAKEAFTYLAIAFKEDRSKKGVPLEGCGWRTRPQILENTRRIHKRHVYGSRGQLGPIIFRLYNRGLIDVQTETGKRSRGGRLTKIRIAHGKEAVKRYVAEKPLQP